jgi:hypothetical protein
VPVIACVLYIIMITQLPTYMASRNKMYLQTTVVAWNFGLSFFSLCGLGESSGCARAYDAYAYTRSHCRLFEPPSVVHYTGRASD